MKEQISSLSAFTHNVTALIKWLHLWLGPTGNLDDHKDKQKMCHWEKVSESEVFLTTLVRNVWLHQYIKYIFIFKKCGIDETVMLMTLWAAELTSLKWGSRFLQPYGPSSRPFSGTFYTCTFSLWSCPSPWISHRTPPWNKNKSKFFTRRGEELSCMNHGRYSRFNNLTQVIFVRHVWRIVVIPLFPDC